MITRWRGERPSKKQHQLIDAQELVLEWNMDAPPVHQEALASWRQG
jgi:hypothetical protein